MSGKRISMLVLALAALGLAGFAGVYAGDPSPAPAEGADRPFKPAASVEALMLGQSRCFDAITDLVGSDDEKRFERMALNAKLLAELANVNHYHRNAKDYREFAGDLQRLSLELAAAADKRDLDTVKDRAKQVHSTCKACHDVYR